MRNQTILLKVKERLNKLDSSDFDLLESWQIVEAFCKAQVEWIRRQLIGTNPYRDGDEGSKRRIDDLNILLTTLPLTLTSFKIYYQSTPVPTSPSSNAYLEYKRIDLYAKSKCCSDTRLIQVYQGEEANVPWYLEDDNKKPSFDWAETFMTFYNGRVRIYTNDEFTITSAKLIYYRQPKTIQIIGTQDPYTGTLPATERLCEFKDDIVELMIDDAAAILAGDIESWQQSQRESQNAERNN